MESQEVTDCDLELLQCKLNSEEPQEPLAELPCPAEELPEPPVEPQFVTVKVEPLASFDESIEDTGFTVTIKREFPDDDQCETAPWPRDDTQVDIKPNITNQCAPEIVHIKPDVWDGFHDEQCNPTPLNLTKSSKVNENCSNNTITFKEISEIEKKTPKSSTDSEKQRYPCSVCDYTFASPASLRRHSNVHSGPVSYNCNICQQSFPSRPELTRHKSLSCQSSRSHTCPHCDQRFLLESRLKSHMRKHTDERPFQCNQCEMKFKWKCTLVQHQLLHNDVKPYACTVCGKRFAQAGLIKPHMRSHTGERPFQCPQCLRRFTHKHNMEKHQLRHNNVKQLVCEVCHKAFKLPSKLKYHMRVHWSDPKPFKCGHCTRAFSHRQNITRHYRRKHPAFTYTENITDASVATVEWEKSIANKKEAEFILPE